MYLACNQESVELNLHIVQPDSTCMERTDEYEKSLIILEL